MNHYDMNFPIYHLQEKNLQAFIHGCLFNCQSVRSETEDKVFIY